MESRGRPTLIFETWLVAADGTGTRRPCGQLKGSRMPDWDPLGEGFLAVAYPPGNQMSEVFAVDTIACTATALTGSGGYKDTPRYAPDGSRIAYCASGSGDDGRVWVIDRDGGNARQVTPVAGREPSWSPDGTELVYTDARPCRGSGRGVLWILNLATGKARQLTTQWVDSTDAGTRRRTW